MIERKTFPGLATKVLDEDQGIVETIFTTFGNVDYGDDVGHPGMFAKTIAERGHKVKILDIHKADSLSRVLGKPLELRELTREQLPGVVLSEHPDAMGGAYAKVQFLLDTPQGKNAFTLLKEGAVDEWSYAYDAMDFDYSEVEQNGSKKRVRNLRTVKLYDVSPVLWGMNPATATLSAKMEYKPEETEEYIHIPVRDADGFQDGSFRTINISASKGIRAVIGRLKGETTTTVQKYLFAKDKGWTMEKAKAWVEEHKKSAKDDVGLQEQISAIYQAFESQIARPATQPQYVSDLWVQEVFEERIRVRDNEGHYYEIPYKVGEDGVTFAPREEWIEGSMEFVPSKASEKVDDAPDGRAALNDSTTLTDDDLGAGPVRPPTSSATREIVRQRLIELKRIEVGNELEREVRTSEGPV